MKIHYHPKNRLKSIYKGKIVFIIFLFIVSVLFFSIFDGGLIRVATPVWIGENALVRNVANFFKLISSKQILIVENENLKNKLASNELALSICSSGQNQNELLAYTFSRDKNTTNISATVVARPPKTLFDTVIIDAGEEALVRVGDNVYIPQGAIIGVVIEVFSKSSRVKLFSTSGEKVDAVLERGVVPTVLTGRGGGAFEASVPRDTAVVVGDRVLSSSIEALFIGVVEDIEMTPTDSFKKVLIRSSANIFSLHFVSIRHE